MDVYVKGKKNERKLLMYNITIGGERIDRSGHDYHESSRPLILKRTR